MKIKMDSQALVPLPESVAEHQVARPITEVVKNVFSLYSRLDSCSLCHLAKWAVADLEDGAVIKLANSLTRETPICIKIYR